MVARNRLVISGTLGAAGQEEFSCGINFGPGAGSPIDTPTDLNVWAAKVGAYLTSLDVGHAVRAWLSSSAGITRIDAYYYAGSGPATAAGFYDFPARLVGTGTLNKTFQTARVVTLLTALAGRRNRGRIYWPHLVATMNTDGTIAQTQQQADEWADAIAEFGTYDDLLDPLEPVVYSAVADTVTPVTQISIGNVLDTQRRRRESLVETRLIANV